jgi:hypothetical protein
VCGRPAADMRRPRERRRRSTDEIRGGKTRLLHASARNDHSGDLGLVILRAQVHCSGSCAIVFPDHARSSVRTHSVRPRQLVSISIGAKSVHAPRDLGTGVDAYPDLHPPPHRLPNARRVIFVRVCGPCPLCAAQAASTAGGFAFAGPQAGKDGRPRHLIELGLPEACVGGVHQELYPTARRAYITNPPRRRREASRHTASWPFALRAQA